MRLLLILYFLLSATTLLVYGWDKRAARIGGRRVRERTLHLLALAGGFPGALAGQRLFHHKRRKPGFIAVTWLIAMIHAGAWVAASWWRSRGG